MLRHRGDSHDGSAFISQPLQTNLLVTGSGRLAGGATATQELVETIGEFNFDAANASNLMTLACNKRNKDEGRRKNMAEDAVKKNQLAEKEIDEQSVEGKRTTAGVVFGNLDGVFGPMVLNAVELSCQNREAHEEAKASKKKISLRKQKKEVATIRAEMAKKKTKFRWTNDKLKKMIRWKAQPGDAKKWGKMPTLREELLNRYKNVKGRASPQASPSNFLSELFGEEADKVDLPKLPLLPANELEEESIADKESDDEKSNEKTYNSSDDEAGDDNDEESLDEELIDTTLIV